MSGDGEPNPAAGGQPSVLEALTGQRPAPPTTPVTPGNAGGDGFRVEPERLRQAGRAAAAVHDGLAGIGRQGEATASCESAAARLTGWRTAGVLRSLAAGWSQQLAALTGEVQATAAALAASADAYQHSDQRGARTVREAGS